jgi:hypothetical protein
VLRAQQQLQRQQDSLPAGSSEEEVVERVMRIAEREVGFILCVLVGLYQRSTVLCIAEHFRL